MYIVRLADDLENLSGLEEIRDAQSAFYSTLNNLHGKELDSAEAMDEYYKYYFSGKGQAICYPSKIPGVSLVDLLSHNRIGVNNIKRSGGQAPILAQAFKTAGDYFQVIEEKDMVDTLVEYDAKSADLITTLNTKLSIKELEAVLPQLQPYTVSLSQSMLRSLGYSVYTAASGNIKILLKQYYDAKTGVSDIPSQMEFLTQDFSGKEDENEL